MNRNPESGITLIELLVAMTLGLFIIAGSFLVYQTTNDVRRANDRVARLQETARVALEILTEEIRLAGYIGRVGSVADVTGYKDSAVPLAAATRDCENLGYIDFAQPLDVIDGVNGVTPYAATTSCIAAAEYQPVTDVLVVRHVSPVQQTTFGADEMGDAFIRADLSTGELFIWDGNAATFPDITKFSAPQVEDHQLQAGYFYVGTHAYTPGDNIPSLRRNNLEGNGGGGNPQFFDRLVMPYVEGMQIQVGIDTDGDADADQYVNRTNTTDMTRAVAVRVWVLVRAEEPDRSFTNNRTYNFGNRSLTVNDNFPRLLVSQTVRLRNYNQSRF